MRHISHYAALATVISVLSACATPQVRYVPTYCITRAQLDELKKAEPGKVHDKLTGDAAKDVGILAANAIRLRAHDDGLLEVLGGCVNPQVFAG